MTADRITGDIRTTLSHDSAHKHVAGSAVYVDDIPTTDDTLVFTDLMITWFMEMFVTSANGARWAASRASFSRTRSKTTMVS